VLVILFYMATTLHIKVRTQCKEVSLVQASNIKMVGATTPTQVTVWQEMVDQVPMALPQRVKMTSNRHLQVEVDYSYLPCLYRCR